MPTFTPPTAPDRPLGYTSDQSDSYKLFKYYAPIESGLTVWKDESDVWHGSHFPYAGGETSRYYNDDEATYSAATPGLATAKKVYLGGHVYTVTEAEAAELIGAGFGSGLNIEPIDLIWTEEDIGRLTNKVASPGVGEVPQTPFIDGEQRIAFPLDSPSPGFSSGRRDYWMVDGTGGWTDVFFETILSPVKFGLQDADPDFDLLPQMGVCLRRKFQSGKWRAVTINNNIFLRLAFPNIGVWEMNEDGSGFANRQFSYELFHSFPLPYVLQGSLIGNIVTITTHPVNSPPQWNNPIYTKVINLDTDAGNSVTIPTPSGAGDSLFSAGIVAAHSTANPDGYCRSGRTRFWRIS